MSLTNLNDRNHSSKTKRVGRTLVVMGDSIVDRAKIVDATTYYWTTSKSFVPYMFSEMGWPWRLLNVASASGEGVSKINSRLKYGVYPYRPDDVLYLGGINDAHTFTDPSNADAVLNDLIEDLIKPCIDFNIRPIVCTLLPSNDLDTTAKQYGWYKFNDALRNYSCINPYMRLVDLQTGTYSNPTNGYGGLSGSLDDNFHPNTNGAARIGVAVRRSLTDLIMPPGGRGGVFGDPYNACSRDSKSFYVSDTSGIKGGTPTPTGNVPSGWQVVGECSNSTGVTIVCSIESASDGGQDWAKIVISGSGMSGQANLGWSLLGVNGVSTSGGLFSPGDWVEMRADCEITAGHVGLVSLSGMVSFIGASRAQFFFPRTLNAAGFVAASDLSGFRRIGTIPFKIPSDCTSIRAQASAKFQTGLAAASATIRIRNMELRKVDVPVIPQYIP